MKYASFLVAFCAFLQGNSFSTPAKHVRNGRHRCVATVWPRHETKLGNFFKGLFDRAFENDPSLTRENMRTGQLEGPGDSELPKRELTPTQEKWKRLEAAIPSLAGRRVEMDFFLSGVPEKDPSNDLYGSPINISSRDRMTGLTLPQSPSVRVAVEFLNDEKCRCLTSTPFTVANSTGDWKSSEKGDEVRFRIDVSGFSRTVETTGTIQKIYWSGEDEKVRKTSTTYSIPPGWLYGEAKLTKTASGELEMYDGILKIEVQSGLLGVASKMVPCGRFTIV